MGVQDLGFGVSGLVSDDLEMVQRNSEHPPPVQDLHPGVSAVIENPTNNLQWMSQPDRHDNGKSILHY